MFCFYVFFRNKRDLFVFGKVLSKIFFSQAVVFLLGHLGVGKTALTKSVIGNFLNYELVVKSPTYTIAETYCFFDKTIYHFDFYRLVRSYDLWDLDLQSYLGENVILFVEWGNMFSGCISSNVFIYFFCYSKFGRVLILKSKFLNFKKIFG